MLWLFLLENAILILFNGLDVDVDVDVDAVEG